MIACMHEFENYAHTSIYHKLVGEPSFVVDIILGNNKSNDIYLSIVGIA